MGKHRRKTERNIIYERKYGRSEEETSQWRNSTTGGKASRN
jgi:hypothetical protein